MGNSKVLDGEGNDILIVSDKGIKILESEEGDDRLFGGQGDDSYIFYPDDGWDLINDIGGNDTIVFIGGIIKKTFFFKRMETI